MSTASETIPFQAEVEELLDLMIHSLYSHREIFLRELISNASDALDKLRIENLTRSDPHPGAERPAIRLELEPARRVLRVIDNGIGMSRSELTQNLGTIARSGTRRYLAGLKERGQGGGEAQIGQFGVGFYSSFMVADRIVVESARAGESSGARWSSDGKGSFTIEDLPQAPRGTRVELHLKPPDPEREDSEDFNDPEVLAAIVRRYSDFVEWPIELAAAQLPQRQDLRRETAADGVEVLILNSQKPLWSRPREEIKPEDYAAFYKHIAHAWDEPLETVHFKGEGASEYTALLFVPGERPVDLMGTGQTERSHISLYVRHVFVLSECEELLPPWLRFVHGVVDSQDLPLNVSRELLQQNRAMARIRARLVRKLLDALGTLRDERRADYERFWRAFGAVLKEGLVTDSEQRETLAQLLLCETSLGQGLATIAEYVARLPEGQDELLCLAADDSASAARSPHLEGWRAAGREVLLFTDPVDEWVLEHCRELAGKRLRRIDRGEALPQGETQREELEQRERDERALLEALEARLSEHVARVRFSARLVESPAVLVDDPGAVGPHLQRALRQSGQEPPPRKRTLELNPQHPLVERLAALARETPGAPRVGELAELLHGQALLAEGSPLPDPARFGKLLNDLLLASI
jgi:molecular chaperone HtpG